VRLSLGKLVDTFGLKPFFAEINIVKPGAYRLPLVGLLPVKQNIFWKGFL
jgi:hypothetical protein